MNVNPARTIFKKEESVSIDQCIIYNKRDKFYQLKETYKNNTKI